MKEVSVIAREPELLIALSGEIDAGNADDFYAEFARAYDAPVNVTFECSALEFIDSTTLGTFVKILKRIRTEDRSMKLTGLNARLKKLFVICALDTIMEIA